MKELNKDNLVEEVKAGLTVVAFLKAEGCGNCEAMKPVLAEFEKANPNIKVCTYICKDGKDVPAGFQFRMFPGIFSFSEGKPVRGYSGIKSLQQMSMLFAHPNELKVAYYDNQASADFLKEEIKNYNSGVSAPDFSIAVNPPPAKPLPADMPSGDPGEENCDSCQ